MKVIHVVLAALVLSLSGGAYSQSITFGAAPVKIAGVVHTNGTVGTASQDAIAAASVSSKMVGFQVCNDAVNTSTYMYVGTASQAENGGIMLGKGQCYVCPYCAPALLKTYRVLGQASANGYSVTQFRGQ